NRARSHGNEDRQSRTPVGGLGAPGYGGAVSALAEEIKAAVRDVLREELPHVLAKLRGEASQVHAPERMLSVQEASRHLGLANSSVYKMAARCELPSVKV